MQVEEAVCAANLHSLSKGSTDIGSTDNIFSFCTSSQAGCRMLSWDLPYTHTRSERRETEK